VVVFTCVLGQLSEYTRPGFWYGLAALAGAYLVVIFIAAMSERRRTRPYGLPHPVRAGTPIDSYHAAMNDNAAAAGFLYGGTFQHPGYDVRVSIWISPDHLTLIETGAGTIMGRRVMQTDLFSRVGDDVVLVTSDHYSDGDPSRLLRFAHHYNGSLENLLALHRRRLEGCGAAPKRFDQGSPIDALQEIYAHRAQRLVRAGRAKWLDTGHHYWRFTLAGSLCVCRGFLIQLGNALSRFWRRWRPRPGVLQGSRLLDPRHYAPAKSM
jgi:hypothetical protein